MKRYLTAIVLLGLLSACASVPKGNFCDTAKPILWAPADTDATIRQVKAHNAVGKDQCGWG